MEEREVEQPSLRVADLVIAKQAMRVSEIVDLGIVSRSTVKRAIKSGELPSYAIGRARLVRSADAVAWITGAA